jgi:hypothetical protein
MRGTVFALCLIAALPTLAQRIQFGSPVADGAAAAPLSPASQPPTWSTPPAGTIAPNTTAAPLSSTFDPYASPAAQAPSAFAPPPAYGAPAPYSPYAPSPYSPTPQAIYPDGIATPQILPPGGLDFAQPIRFLQEIRGRYTWLSPMGSQSLGVNDVETSATFAVPLFRATYPFLITPGFATHFFQGPVTQPPGFAELPPVTYDAYLDTAWHPQITPWLGANLGVRVGAYSDFHTFNTQSIRIMGRGLGIITLTPNLQVAMGVVYIDRVLVKILPAGGLIWIPNPDARYEILFPNPKLARRWTTIGNTEVWLYASGEYGGGSWTIQRSDGSSDQVDYDDIRVSLGLETYGFRGLHSFFEVGYVFNRKIIYRDSPTPEYDASDTVMLRAGASY